MSLPNSDVKVLTPSVTAFEDKTFKMVIKGKRGLKSRALI